VSPVRYEQGFYVPEDGTLHSDRCDNLKCYIVTAVLNADESSLRPTCFSIRMNSSCYIASADYLCHGISFDSEAVTHSRE
jgi:hypothetical protein